MTAAVVQSLRPRQWIKNILVFAGILFSKSLFDTAALSRALGAFFIFCLMSGTVYMLNDLRDREQDRLHPEKRKRPIASGALTKGIAVAWIAVMTPVLLAGAFGLNVKFGFTALAYMVLMASYVFLLKGVVILDVLIIASGFVIRAVAGAEVIDVSISSWLLICASCLALFLSLVKRRRELILLGKDARHHRKILEEYSPYLLDQMIAVMTASTLMSYTLYTTSIETVQKFGSRNLVMTVPFVIYGIFRYLYLVHQKGMGGSPETAFFKDRSMIVNAALYVSTVAILIYVK